MIVGSLHNDDNTPNCVTRWPASWNDVRGAPNSDWENIDDTRSAAIAVPYTEYVRKDPMIRDECIRDKSEETYVGIDTTGQPSCRRFLARYSGAGASIAGAECLAGRTDVAFDFSDDHEADGDVFPS